MTDTEKKTAGWTLAGLVAAILLVGPAWPTIEKILLFLAPIAQRQTAQAVGLSWFVAGCIGVVLPYVLPASWLPGRTELWLGVAAAVLGAASCIGLLYVPEDDAANRTAVIYGLGLAGLGSVPVNQLLRLWLYKAFPRAKPASLQP